jgi:EpsI family protein
MAEERAGSPPATALIRRRHFLVGGALTAASGLAIARQPTAHFRAIEGSKFESWVPAKFGSWSVVGSSGVVLPPPDALRDRLYDNLVTRVYMNESAPPVMFLLAYNNLQDGVVQVHRPEVCYPVGGFELSEVRKVPLRALGKILPANAFSARAANRTEQVVYVTRLGGTYPRSWAEQRWAVIQENLAGRIPDGMMMRVSLLGEDQAKALETLLTFAAEFLAASPDVLRKLIVL